LFSDIEGSTHRWERYGEAMRDALRRHDEILRAEIEARRGYVFKTIGDAFCAAFWTAGEALEAAIAAQRRLALQDFGTIDGLNVRMAIHAGQTDERAGDYYGAAVNRTARLLGAGHGGQILLSGFAADLALPALPSAVTLRHLGMVPLRDIKEPERVFQPIAAGLRSEFKPLRALETPPNNLPHQTTSFVGRHDDLMRVEALLDEVPLVTLAGAGGVGKTRLALEVAVSRINDYHDGTWFVDLSSIANAALIAGTILTAVGGERSHDLDPLDDLTAYLEKRELLLLLDNSEHLVAEVAAIVAHIIARAPHVAVLATSREPLDIAGERLYRLSSLDLEAAVELFADRARAVSPTFSLAEKVPVVEEICRRLDGIALAIELAAARARMMSIENIAAHLELRMLAGGRDRRPRQQTMRALIDWSYDLLAQEERSVLRYASVFLRGFTLNVATDVCGSGADEWHTLELLASLVDKSLVIAEVLDGEQRYRMLEPIREYGGEKLRDAGELPEALRRHAHAFAALAHTAYDEWDWGPREDWLARVERDLANFRAAIQWAVDERNDLELGARLVADATIVFLRLSLLGEGVQRCEQILQAGVVLTPEVEARLRYGLSMLHSNLGANKKVLEQATLAVALDRDVGDSRGLARALSQVASRTYDSAAGDSKASASEALQLARASGDRRLLADVLRRCASSFIGDGEEAVRACYAESVALFRSIGRNEDTARALEWWGHWEAERANFRDAGARLLEAKRTDRREAMAVYLATDIAGCYLAIGDVRRAEPFAREALSLAAKVRHPILMAMAISYSAMIESARDVTKAARLAGYAEQRFRAAEFERVNFDREIAARLLDALKNALTEAELLQLLEEGAAWSDDQAVARALSA
jgi:predicted ATPase/class 3 adenylate cyclase